jgi:hypothetical protein
VKEKRNCTQQTHNSQDCWASFIQDIYGSLSALLTPYVHNFPWLYVDLNHKLSIYHIKSDNTKNKTVMKYSTHDYKCARVVCMLKKLYTLNLKIPRHDKPPVNACNVNTDIESTTFSCITSKRYLYCSVINKCNLNFLQYFMYVTTGEHWKE